MAQAIKKYLTLGAAMALAACSSNVQLRTDCRDGVCGVPYPIAITYLIPATYQNLLEDKKYVPCAPQRTYLVRTVNAGYALAEVDAPLATTTDLQLRFSEDSGIVTSVGLETERPDPVESLTNTLEHFGIPGAASSTSGGARSSGTTNLTTQPGTPLSACNSNPVIDAHGTAIPLTSVPAGLRDAIDTGNRTNVTW